MSTIFQNPTVTIPSAFSGVLTQTNSLDMNSVSATTPVFPTQSDPDAPTTTISSSSALISQPTPTGIAQAILPNPPLDPSSIDPTEMSLISLLFGPQLGYEFMLMHEESQLQVWLYVPVAISNALNISSSEVKGLQMKYYAPPNYNGDPTTLLTLYNAYIPFNMVKDLQSQLSVKTSPYYTASSGIAGTLASITVPSFPINFVPDPNSGPVGPGGGSGGSGSSANKRFKAVIAVCSAVAGVILFILAIWRYKVARNRRTRRDQARQRVFARHRGYGSLDEGQDIMHEAPSVQSVIDVSPHALHRRDSFWHAEDTLREHQRELRRSQVYHVPPYSPPSTAAAATVARTTPVYDQRTRVHFSRSVSGSDGSPS